MTFSKNADDFAKSISALRHDLRTPINAIIGYSEMLMEDLQGEQNSDFFQEIKRLNAGGYELLTMINNHLQSTDRKIIKSQLEFSTFFEEMKLEMIPTLKKVIAVCNSLKTRETTVDIFSDIERIAKASYNLQKLVNTGVEYSQVEVLQNIDSINLSEIGKSYELNTNLFHILVVDDDDNNRDLFCRQLEREGYRVSVAVDGRQALVMLEAVNYDLILLDLLMPVLNGYDTLKQLKQTKKWCDIPVIMISASDEIEMVIQCLKIGAEDYLPKPSNSILLKTRIGTALEKRELRRKEIKYLNQINQEIEKGREMQLDFLPRDVIQPLGWNIAGFFQPAYQMAGDFYDVFWIDEENVLFVVADVCDKGVGAALFMALFRSLIRLFSQTKSQAEIQNSHDHALQAVELTNHYIAEHHEMLTMFATMFVGALNIKTGLVSYINAGHETVFVINSQGKISQNLKRTAPAVGMMPNVSFKIQQAHLEYGDTLFGYTDGVPEAKAPNGEFFQMNKLMSILEEPFISATALLEKISNRLTTYIGEAQQFDDITMIAITRRLE